MEKKDVSQRIDKVSEQMLEADRKRLRIIFSKTVLVTIIIAVFLGGFVVVTLGYKLFRGTQTTIEVTGQVVKPVADTVLHTKTSVREKIVNEPDMSKLKVDASEKLTPSLVAEEMRKVGPIKFYIESSDETLGQNQTGGFEDEY